MYSNHSESLNSREKLLINGAQSLSDLELLTFFISCGNTKKTSQQLASNLLGQLGNLRAILNADIHHFKQTSGLGFIRYLQLKAAEEICRRSDFITLQKSTPLTNSKDTHHYLKRQLRDKKNETFVALFLDSQNRIIAYEELFSGTINTTSVHSRPIIERVLKYNAASVIVAHNHPSGNSEASEQDFSVTQRLRQALELVDAYLLDHLIIGDNEVYSIASRTKWHCHT